MIRHISYILPLMICLVVLYRHYIISETLNCSSSPPSWLKHLSKDLNQYHIPGFQVSFISAADSLHCAKGWAEKVSWRNVAGEPLTIEHRFRYLSLSKIFTAILTVEMFNHEDRLNSSVLDWLDLKEFTFSDDRLQDIRVSHLLTHRAGFGLWKGIDPMLVPHPPCPYTSNWLNTVVLEFDPGQYFSYSNIGYCLLGQIGEGISNGQPYSSILQERFFEEFPDIRLATRGRAKDEVLLYSDLNDRYEMISLLDYKALAAVGGWSGSAKSFSKILYSEVSESSQFIKLTRKINTAELSGCYVQLWRGCHLYGVYVYKPDVESPALYWRDGSLPGATAFAGWLDNGETIVMLFNTRKLPWIDFNDQIGKKIYEAIVSNVRGL